MDVPLDLSEIFPSCCVRLDSLDINRLISDVKYAPFWIIFDQMTKLSSLAQNLKHVLTTSQKFLKSTGQVLYVLWTKGSSPTHSIILGYLKCGRRILYLHDELQECKKLDPVCLFDFYVHGSVQRIGYGKMLYDSMLQGEKINPNMIAIDKPSENLLKFLAKHYKLTGPRWQANHYVIYPNFFSTEEYAGKVNGSINATENANHSEFGPQKVFEPLDLITHLTISNHDKNNSLHSHLEVNEKAKSVNSTRPSSPDSQGSISTSEMSGHNSLSPSAGGRPPSNLAKERMILAMGHHKLW